jgi:hypothetical protein
MSVCIVPDPAATATRDQRRVKRPAHRCDSGAFEVTVARKKKS